MYDYFRVYPSSIFNSFDYNSCNFLNDNTLSYLINLFYKFCCNYRAAHVEYLFLRLTKILPYDPSRGLCWLIDWLLSPNEEDEVAVAERFDDIGLVPPDLLLLSPDPEVLLLASWSVGWPAFLRIRLMEETEGMLFGSQIRCPSSWSLISQANKAGFSDFNRRILLTTDGVATCCY